MAAEDRAALHHHVFGRHAAPAPVFVLAALDADAVVAHVEAAVAHDDVAARFDVDAVAVLRIGGVAHRHSVDRQVAAEQRVDVPRRRVLEHDALQQDVLAVDQTDHHRAQEIFHRGPLLVGGQRARHVHVGHRVAPQRLFAREPVGRALVASAACGDAAPGAFVDLLAFERTPIFAVAVDDALARDGDVAGSARRDGRLAAARVVVALERGLDQRVEALVVREEDDGSPFHLQADVGAQDDRSRVPDSCRYAQRAAALGGQVVDRRRESFGREAGTARIASEAGQRRFPFRDGRQRHLRHGERQFVGVVVAGRLRRGRCQRQCAQQQGRESFHACSNDCL